MVKTVQIIPLLTYVPKGCFYFNQHVIMHSIYLNELFNQYIWTLLFLPCDAFCKKLTLEFPSQHQAVPLWIAQDEHGDLNPLKEKMSIRLINLHHKITTVLFTTVCVLI